MRSAEIEQSVKEKLKPKKAGGRTLCWEDDAWFVTGWYTGGVVKSPPGSKMAGSEEIRLFSQVIIDCLRQAESAIWVRNSNECHGCAA